MNSATSSTWGGYTCPSCHQFVTYGGTHHCSGSASAYYDPSIQQLTLIWQVLQTLQRIEKLLDKVVDRI